MLADHHPYHHTVTITLGGFSTLAYLTLVSVGGNWNRAGGCLPRTGEEATAPPAPKPATGPAAPA
jgi:hypothetical protein